MNIIERNEDVVVRKTVRKAIACDGTEFDSEKACINYENHLKRKEKLATIEHNSLLDNMPPMDSDWNDYSENSKFYWYRPKNIEEIKLLNEVCETSFDESNIRDWICIEEFGGRYYGAGSLIQCLKSMEAFISLFGYTANISLSPSTNSDTDNDKHKEK